LVDYTTFSVKIQTQVCKKAGFGNKRLESEGLASGVVDQEEHYLKAIKNSKLEM
jgi:hypothetical protein